MQKKDVNESTIYQWMGEGHMPVVVYDLCPSADYKSAI